MNHDLLVNFHDGVPKLWPIGSILLFFEAFARLQTWCAVNSLVAVFSAPHFNLVIGATRSALR